MPEGPPSGWPQPTPLLPNCEKQAQLLPLANSASVLNTCRPSFSGERDTEELRSRVTWFCKMKCGLRQPHFALLSMQMRGVRGHPLSAEEQSDWQSAWLAVLLPVSGGRISTL